MKELIFEEIYEDSEHDPVFDFMSFSLCISSIPEERKKSILDFKNLNKFPEEKIKCPKCNSFVLETLNGECHACRLRKYRKILFEICERWRKKNGVPLQLKNINLNYGNK